MMLKKVLWAMAGAFVVTLGFLIYALIFPNSSGLERLSAAGNFATAIGATSAIMVAVIAIWLENYRDDRRSIDASHAWSAMKRLEESLRLATRALQFEIQMTHTSKMDHMQPVANKKRDSSLPDLYTPSLEYLLECIVQCRKVGAFRVFPEFEFKLGGGSSDVMSADIYLFLFESQIRDEIRTRKTDPSFTGSVLLRSAYAIMKFVTSIQNSETFRSLWNDHVPEDLEDLLRDLPTDGIQVSLEARGDV
jgi:hypothetical protein